MDTSLKQRLVGAVVLIALAVIFLPMLVKGPAPDSGVSDVPLDIPAEPRSTDLQTRDLPLEAPGSVPPGGATGMPGTVIEGAPAVPAQGGMFPSIAAGDYAVSFGSYATAADADRVIGALRSAELPAYREATNVAGRTAQRVRIGPFADRAIAEAARLRASGATRLCAPSAALEPGGAAGWRVEAGLRPGPARDGMVHVLFGARPTVTGWRAGVGRPPAELCLRVRHFQIAPPRARVPTP